jgi:hypothetical protein
VTKPFTIYGEEIEAEAAEHERRLIYEVGFWVGRYDRCRRHA